jgi:penicillin-binding protein 1A
MTRPVLCQSKATPKKAKRGLASYLLYGFLLTAVLITAAGVSFFIYYSHSLPDLSLLKKRTLGTCSLVYSEEDEVVAKFLVDKRIPIPYEKIPNRLVRAFLGAEDADFFRHSGVDFKGIVRATFKNLTAGRITQGGSTITQQVVKIFFLNSKKSFWRKLKEAAYAFGLERALDKEQILFYYLNNVYLGNGAYGIEAASESYFNKDVGRLSLAETAMLAGLVKAPSFYCPVTNLPAARQRQAYVLARMLHLGFVSRNDYERALLQPITLEARESAYFSKAPYFSELIRQHVEKKYGKEGINREGLKIYTTLKLSYQRAAQESLDAGLRELDKRQGFRGPIRSLSAERLRAMLMAKRGPPSPAPAGRILEGVILSADDPEELYRIWVEGITGVLPYSEMAWALRTRPSSTSPRQLKRPGGLLKRGDVIHVKIKNPSGNESPPVFVLEQEPIVQGALICIDPRTGDVKAMVGGRDFGASQFNRAVYSKRQPGSVFKPFIYAAALERGYTPSSILTDSPVEYAGTDGESTWSPENYDRNFNGPIAFGEALAFSRNVVTVKILDDIGINRAIRFVKKFGIQSPMERNLSIALGTSEISMLELTSAFGVFANGGERVKPVLIRKIVRGGTSGSDAPDIETDENGESEEIPPTQKERVVSPKNAFLMTGLLQDVVRYGTGQRAKALGRPVAGKTGTSSNCTDAWFIGYTPSLLTSVWVGFDDKTSLGENETGARAALPIWVSFMKKALRKTPVEEFKIPEGVDLPGSDMDTERPSSDEKKSVSEPTTAGSSQTSKSGNSLSGSRIHDEG